MKRAWIISSVALLLVGCARHDARVPESPSPRRVHVVQGRSAPAAGWVAVTLSASRRAALSTRIGASVRKVHVTEGQFVPAGALLVSLADEDLQGGLRAAEAAVAAARAHHTRILNLAKAGASTPSELDMAQTQLAQAQAALLQVKANLSYTQIRAPFPGVVQARRVNEGDFVAPGTPLLELEGQGALELQGSLSEEESKGLKMGQKLVFEAEDRMGMAEITGLATGGDPVSHRGTLRARVLQGSGTFRTGTFARLRLPGGAFSESGLGVPKSALVIRGELSGVFVIRNGKAELRWLSLGEAQGEWVPVRAGLAKGELVIDKPGDLKDGQPVQGDL